MRAFAAEPDFTTASAGSLQVAAAAIDARNSTFEMSGLAGTVRIALASAPSGWWIKSAFIGPTNAADPVLLQYIGGKFVTIVPQQAAIAEAVWPMK